MDSEKETRTPLSRDEIVDTSTAEQASRAAKPLDNPSPAAIKAAENSFKAAENTLRSAEKTIEEAEDAVESTVKTILEKTGIEAPVEIPQGTSVKFMNDGSFEDLKEFIGDRAADGKLTNEEIDEIVTRRAQLGI